jgi:hypothetical protein
MTIQRMDHVGIVVDDREAASAFLAEPGLELEGEAPVCAHDVAALMAEIRSFMNAISAALSVRSIAAR